MKTLRLAGCLIGALATFDHGWAQAPDLRKPDNRPSQAIAQPEPKFRREVEVVDANSAPWSSIGKVGNSIGGHCTGTVIGSNRFVTAAHCLYNKPHIGSYRPGPSIFCLAMCENNTGCMRSR